MKCNECGSENLVWDYTLSTTAPAGALSQLNEVSVLLILGCEECSETIAVRPLAEMIVDGDVQNALFGKTRRSRVQHKYETVE